jgi:ring-1,2-phenylacetyl-CoA epoxidase subunit PaaE
MSQFHSLRVAAKQAETGRAISLQLAIAPDVAPAFAYAPGQHVVLRAFIDGQELRRTYSICADSAPDRLSLCIRSDGSGRMSTYLRERIQAGSRIDVFPPTGRFGVPAGSMTGGAAHPHYLAIAAGIGITPILTIVSAILAAAPSARVTLMYCSRDTDSVLFTEALQGLKDRYLERLSLHFFMSRESQEIALYNGRIDAAKIRDTATIAFEPRAIEAAFICAPEAMMSEAAAALQELGVAPARIHAERFVTTAAQGQPAPSPGRAGAPVTRATDRPVSESLASVTVKMDGRVRSFRMPRDGSVSVLDAAESAGVDLPYSCKGGVCSTCRTHLGKGSVRMNLNYALEDSEVEAGFVLTCQSIPTSADIELDYDLR